jgi:hypothetical protein
LFVKLKFANFTQTTVECVGRAPNIAQFGKLMETGFARGNQPVRLLGVRASTLEPRGAAPLAARPVQGELFG